MVSTANGSPVLPESTSVTALSTAVDRAVARTAAALEMLTH
jgi:hypothetical protein